MTNSVLPLAKPKQLTNEEEAENLRRFNANLKRVANLKKRPQMKAVLQAPAALLSSSKPAVSGRVQHVLPGSRQFAPLAFKHSRGKIISMSYYFSIVKSTYHALTCCQFFRLLGGPKNKSQKLEKN